MKASWNFLMGKGEVSPDKQTSCDGSTPIGTPGSLPQPGVYRTRSIQVQCLM